jgi:hypothetical protein
MQPYQERVVIEHKELSNKIDKLIVFIDSEYFKSLDLIDQSLLKQQLDVMIQYRSILLKRMNRFQYTV